MKQLLCLVALASAASATYAEQPAPIKACSILAAQKEHKDTARIQSALNLCNPGQAVILTSDGDQTQFLAGPLIIPRGVTLFVDRGVTLFASKNPRDYDLSAGSCGTPQKGKAPNCKPFLYAYQAAYSGVAGWGTIDGQGFAWWPNVQANPTIAVPDLVSSYESQGFKISGVTLRNAAGIHAAIYKTIGFSATGLHIESAEGGTATTGLLLSNAVDADILWLWIRGPGDAIAMKASILGPTQNVKFEDVHLLGGRGIVIGDDVYGAVDRVTIQRLNIQGAKSAMRFNLKGTESGAPKEIRVTGGCLRDVAEALAAGPALFENVIENGRNGAACTAPSFHASAEIAYATDASTVAKPGKKRALVVNPGESVQKALNALPVTGGDIVVKPGTYREVVTIRKPHVHLRGEDPDPAKTVIVCNNGARTNGGTFNSSTVFVEADDVTIDHMSLVNDAGAGKGQAVALHVTGDRAVFRNLRISGAQDTLFAASRYCYGDYGPCPTARQYFADSFIEGNIDFIFGDAKAVFQRCELHGVPTGNVMFTAQSRHVPEQESGYVFDHCKLTGEARANGVLSLGRSWRPYATVVFLNAKIDAPVISAGWTEWLRFGVPTLPTAYYAEFNSTGPGANPEAREKHSHQLTAAEAEKWAPAAFLAGADGWNPVTGK
jgi:pectin methylesterase-like acyl-CoA thioesterase